MLSSLRALAVYFSYIIVALKLDVVRIIDLRLGTLIFYSYNIILYDIAVA